MRTIFTGLTASLAAALPPRAQEAEAQSGSLLTPTAGLMFWTLLIFVVVLAILSKFAYPKILEAVQSREKALEDAIAAAKKDREDAAALLAEHQKAIAATRDEAQKIIADARAAGEKVRTDVVEQAHREQQGMLERARTEINSEKEKALAELRKQTVELAVRAASKVIERNLDVEANRAVVERFLASIEPAGNEALMREPTIARNYAETLVSLAERAGDLDGWGQTITQVADAIESDPRLANFLASPKVSAKRKVEIITKAFQDTLPRLFVRFLGAVITNRRQHSIPQIASEYALLVDAIQGRVHARVTVASEPDEALRAIVEEQLGAVTGKRVVPHFIVKPEILGGMIARVGDTVMDGSLARRLETLRGRMLGRAS